MKKNILLSTSAAFLLFTSNIKANENLEVIEVWETQIESSSLNLGKDSIETKQADHLSDLLRDLPGVGVGGTHVLNTRLYIRGIGDEDLEITIDGAKQNNVNMFHHIGNTLINPDILKKADIQVGNNSVVNGGLGGSIAFETKDGKDMLSKGKSFGARLSSTYNSNDSISGSITGYGKAADASFLVYHNQVNKNDWEYANGQETFGVEGTNKNTLAKLSYDLNDNQSISLSYDLNTDKGDYLPRPDWNKEANVVATGVGTLFDSEFQRETITLKHELDLGDNFKLDTTLYSNKSDFNRDEDWNGGGPRPDSLGNIKAENSTLGFNLKGQSVVENNGVTNILTYGASYDKQESGATWKGATFNGKYGKDETADTVVLFLEDSINFENDAVITPGVRYTNYDLDGNYGRIDDSVFTYSIAGEYPLTDDLRAVASYTTLYKGAPMSEALTTTRTWVKDSNIKSETGSNKEVGINYYNNDLEGADSFAFAFKYFKTDIKNEVVTTWLSRTEAQMENSGKTEYKGFEASARYVKGDFNALVTFSKTESERSTNGKETAYNPGDKLTFTTNYKFSSELDGRWNSIFVKGGGTTNNTYATEKIGYGVHNLSLRYNPKSLRNLSIIAGVDNIFDKEYKAHNSNNRVLSRGRFNGLDTSDYEPGRNFKVTASYKF